MVLLGSFDVCFILPSVMHSCNDSGCQWSAESDDEERSLDSSASFSLARLVG